MNGKQEEPGWYRSQAGTGASGRQHLTGSARPLIARRGFSRCKSPLKKINKYPQKIHCQPLNIPLWAFSKKSVPVSISYCLPLARADTILRLSCRGSRPGRAAGLELCGDPGPGNTPSTSSAFALMSQLPTLFKFFFHIPFSPSRRSEREGFLRDQTGEAKLPKLGMAARSGVLSRAGEDSEMKQHPSLFPVLLGKQPDLSSPFREGIRLCSAGLSRGSFHSCL